MQTTYVSRRPSTVSKTITVVVNGNATGYTVSPTSDSNWNISNNGSGTITVSPKAPNTSTTANKTLTLTIANADDPSNVNQELTCTQAMASSPGTSTYIDVLNQTWTGISGTNYSSWTGKDGSDSDAVYAGNCAGDKSSIQLRSNNNNSGIVSTTSGGKLKKIVVSWHVDTNSARILQVYGKNSAYESASDLYDSSKQGSLLGTIAKSSGTELTITGDYEYIGIRSSSGALYLTEVKITWEK